MSALLCLTGTAVAQQAPNAGSILRQLEPDTPDLPAPKADTLAGQAPKRRRPRGRPSMSARFASKATS